MSSVGLELALFGSKLSNVVRVSGNSEGTLISAVIRFGERSSYTIGPSINISMTISTNVSVFFRISVENKKLLSTEWCQQTLRLLSDTRDK